VVEVVVHWGLVFWMRVVGGGVRETQLRRF
jgi:hypothetical protein